MSCEHPKIAFFGHFGSTNFGNESTLRAILQHLRRLAPDADFSCICTSPETVARIYDIEARPSRDVMFKSWRPLTRPARLARKFAVGLPSELYRWVKGFKTLWGTDALIIPGTGLLTDAFTFLDWGPYDMFRWSVTAKLCGCKLFFVSVGAGPVHTRMGRFLIKAALSLADFRSYRDTSTLQYLNGMGFHCSNDPVFPDLAFSLSAPSDHRAAAGRKVVGLGVMEYAGKYSREKRSRATYSPYMKSLAGFVKWLLEQGYDVRLLIGDLADTHVTREFRSLLKDSVEYEDGRIIDEPVESVEDLLSQLAATDFVVATRFHNVLLSLLLNKPVIAISFHHKCSSLMNEMALSEYCEDINNFTSDRLIDQFCELQKNAAHIKWTIRRQVAACQDALDEQYRTIFMDLFPDRQHTTNPAAQIPHDSSSSVLS